MGAVSVHYQTPEDHELQRKQSALDGLQAQLLERELERATLDGELRTFRAQYFRLVGALWAEVDDLKARLAEARAKSHPGDVDLSRAAAEARKQAAESRCAIAINSREDDGDDFVPSNDLKRLYRDLAKLVHPDLSANEDERVQRTRVMAEANDAYANGDEAKLRRLLDDWVSSPDHVQGEGIGAELIRVIRKIHQVERRLADIAIEIDQLQATDIYALKAQVDDARSHGRDLLGEMANDLNRQIASLRASVTAA